MLRAVKSMLRHPVHTQDGEMGQIEDFFIDDESWEITYLIVNTSRWLFGHDVMIAIEAIAAGNWATGEIHVNLTKDQVHEAPSVNTKEPITRGREAHYRGYFGWPYYWVPLASGDNEMSTPEMGSGAVPVLVEDEFAQKKPPTQDEVHIWSLRDMQGYDLKALDGKLGHIDDFILDDRELDVRYLIVDTGDWLPGKAIVIPRDRVSSLNWESATVKVGLTRYQIETAPEFGGLPLSGHDAERLRRHFADEDDAAG